MDEEIERGPIITSYDQVRDEFREIHKDLFGKEISPYIEGRITFDPTYEDKIVEFGAKLVDLNGFGGFALYKGKRTTIRVVPTDKNYTLETLVHEVAHYHNLQHGVLEQISSLLKLVFKKTKLFPSLS